MKRKTAALFRSSNTVMRLHTEGLACAAALIGAVFRRPQRVRGRSRLGARARSRVNRLEGWADDGHKESGEGREEGFFPSPSLFSPFSLFKFHPGGRARLRARARSRVHTFEG